MDQAQLINLSLVISSVVYSLLGIVIFILGFIIVDRLTPYNLWTELCEKNNISVAILVGASAISIAIIIASAIH